MTVGETLKCLRGDKSRREVADGCGITLRALVSYEHDARMPRNEVMKRIADYYGKTVDSIFFAAR